MARLLFLTACFAGALATYDYGGSDKMMGDKSGGEMTNGDMNQKNTMEMKSGEVITVISSYKGGNAPVEKISEPTMNQGMRHKVTVGGDAGLVFSPDTITAVPGDMVEFTFMSMNHTLTQSTFPKPCVKMQGGADSGFLPNPNNTISPPPTYVFQVKDTKSAWFYCKQKKPASHCGKGMTFSINPTADKSQAMFMAMAIQQNGTAPAPDATSMMMPPPAETSMPPPPADTTAMPATTMMPPPPASSPPPASPPAAMPAPPAEAPPASPPPQNLNAEQPAAAPPAVAGNNMVAGAGSMENGQCSCSCLCGTAAFPAGAGMGMYGGWSGAVAM
ncbi:MAG: hypothetical protein Q9166_006992 [cf. Caloplaca sp. 2 TL-2023]